ncbi:MAG: restriction endonuclease subunit S [Spirochaetota bacterium]|nr:restriction endonuclease subunit S [Spirochaetota bacterium]
MKMISSSIPNNWVVKNLTDIFFFQEGPGVRKWQFRDRGIKLLNGSNINNGILDLSNTKIYIEESEARGKYEHFLIDEGDLVIASSGVVVDNFHNKIAFVKKEHLPLCMNTSTIRFKVLDEKQSTLQFLKYFLKTRIFKAQIGRLITGSAQLNFGPTHLKKIKIPLPSLIEQNRIAGILSRAEGLIEKRKESIRLLDEFLKSTFLEMFGDPVRNEKGWEKKRIDELADTRLGKMRDKKFITGNHLKYYLGNSSVRWFSFDFSNLEQMDFNDNEQIKFSLRHGDLLVCEGGEIGRCAIWKSEKEDIYFQKALHRVRVDAEQIKQEYLQYVLLRYSIFGGFKNVTSKATIAHLTGEKLKETYIPLPPIPLQNKFASVVEKIETIKAKYQISLAELERFYGSLSQRAFKGDLDLSGVVVNRG